MRRSDHDNRRKGREEIYSHP